jgi:hypothetical protein
MNDRKLFRYGVPGYDLVINSLQDFLVNPYSLLGCIPPILEHLL